MSARGADMRATSLRIGIQVSWLMCLLVGGWALLTFDRPHRGAILALLALMGLTAAALTRVPAAAITGHRHADRLYAAWSAMAIAAISAAVALDGQALSPLTVTYVLPLLFAALAYPLRLMAAVALADVAACTTTLALATDLPLADVAYIGALLLLLAHLSAAHSRAHARHAAEAELLSRTDVLTGCLNRRGFDEELARRVARTERYGATFGLVVFDLDGFKDVNDRFGHAAGDELLRRVAATAAGTVRTGDVVCRLGGDEFAVLLDGATADCAERAATRLRATLAEHTAVSVGWATCPQDAGDGDGLYRAADAELYRQKRGHGLPHRAAAPGVAPAA